MKGNNFKSALKINVPKIVDSNFKNIDNTNLLLMKLGLFPLPENVQASISDGKYLDLKLKENNNEKHLLFQFPLEETDLSELQNRPDYQELIQRYHLYTTDYIDEVKKYAILERKFIQEKFPNLVFNMKIRIKNYDSYINKLVENIHKGKDLYINDIIGERIIPSKYNGSDDEKLLKKMCDEAAKALYDFRINTNFRIIKDIDSNETSSEKEYLSKDYIEFPKKNGYESIHILLQNKFNKDLNFETQIRTLEMEKNAKVAEEIGHTKYKPRLLNDLSPNRVPIYYEIAPFNDESGNPTIVEIPIENRFYHFYNSDKDMSTENREPSVPITYSNFRKEQYQIEDLLGIQFKDIRAKLRDINLRNKSKQEAR